MFGILQRCGQLVPTSDTIGSLSVSVLTWHWLCGRLMQLCLADASLQRTLAWGSWIMIFRWKRSGESQEEGTTVNIMWATQQRDHKKPDIDFRSNVSIRATHLAALGCFLSSWRLIPWTLCLRYCRGKLQRRLSVALMCYFSPLCALQDVARIKTINIFFIKGINVCLDDIAWK